MYAIRSYYEVLYAFLFEHKVDDIELGLPKFRAVGASQFANVSGIFNDRALKTKTDPEERDLLLTHILNRNDLPLHPPLAEPSGHSYNFV